MAGVSSIQLHVPKTNLPQLPLMQLKVTLELETDQTVSFVISDPRLLAATRELGPFSPGNPLNTDDTLAARSRRFDPNPPGAVDSDTVLAAVPPNVAPATNPQRRLYTFFIELNSDYDLNSNCASTIAAAETWTIAVKPGSPNIVSARVTSYSRAIPGQVCTGNLRPVKIPDLVASIGDIPGGSEESRPGIDVVLVLDRSGSMAGAGTAGNPTPRRIDDLHQAFLQLNQVWQNLRTSEGVATPSDNIGVTIFDDQIAWWNPPLANGLNVFATASPLITLPNMTNATTGIIARGLTSIGGGLKQAAEIPQFAAANPTRRRVILLMTDGLQNTDPKVGVVSGRVNLYTNGVPEELDNQDNFQIYTVTVGPASTVDASIATKLATATTGFYLNSELDAGKQGVFFLELLQNFVRFTTWETQRIISAQLTQDAPVFATTNPFSTTITAVVFALRGPSGASLRLSVTPPGDGQTRVALTASGIASLRFDVPTAPTYDYVGDWQIVVDEEPIITITRGEFTPTAAARGGVAFDLVIIADDAALNADMRVVPKDYAPGDRVELEARVSEFGRPVTGLDGGTNSEMLVQVVQPGIGVGDLLSTSTSSTEQPPFGQDQLSTVQAKLYNHLQDAPDALARHPGNAVTLTEGGDGVYRGSLPVQTSGHYDFVFGLRGVAPNVSRFTRQHVETVYVRPVPAESATDIQTSVQPIPGGQQLKITFTPRTLFYELFGLGWANWFRFTAPGITPFKPADNLDGTFTGTLDFTGPVPPVTLNFLDVAVVIDDSVPPDKLPIPLGRGTVLVSSVQPITAPYVTTWLVLGPIFDPAHQPGPHAGDVSRPKAADILRDIDNHHDQLDPASVTGDLAHAPSHGDIVRHYGGSLIAVRPYEWRKRLFDGMDWTSRSDIGDDIHTHLGGDHEGDPADPSNYLNFAGKNHAMAFFLVYIASPDDRHTFIEVGHDDAVRMWLNGAEIIEPGVLHFLDDFDLVRGHPGFARIKLRQGTNVMLAAVGNTHVDWGFSLRILDPEGLRIAADHPERDPIRACESEYHSVTVAGDGNLWNPSDLDRGLACSGRHTWKGRVRLTDEHFKLVAHRHNWLPDWWGPHGKNIFLDNFHNQTPGIYDLVFFEDDPAHPVLILVKPFAG